MDHLRRDLAPVSEKAWSAIEDEAARTLRHFLNARALVDFEGPHGWDHSAHNLGRVGPVGSGVVEGVDSCVRQVQPLVELRVELELAMSELDAVDRGSSSPDLDPVLDAARKVALGEDLSVFHGYPAGGIVGVIPASPHEPLTISDDYNRYPQTVAKAVSTLRGAGIGGPYGIALGSRCYTGVVETTEHGGYPLLEHLRLILAGGSIVWAPAVDGAVVVSMRGGDYRLVVGQDVSLGYASHTDSAVRLFLEESLTLVVEEPRAGVHLSYRD
jgi:uncharacterized linocin/CFP29 family protein